MRRHLAFMSATVSMGLSSMRMSVCRRVRAAWVTFPQSEGLSRPVSSRPSSTSPSEDSRRVTSCSLLISRENTATVFLLCLATFRAMFRAKELLPMPGRAARSTRSERFRPWIFWSTAEKPLGRPGRPSSPEARALSRSSTGLRTWPTGVRSWALRPRRMA